MEHRKINDGYGTIAAELIQTQPELEYIKNSSVQIIFLESDLAKKNGREQLVLCQCSKVASRNKWAILYDFTITLFAPNLTGLNEEQIKTVIFHELLHIGIERSEKGENYFVRRHDFSDFKAIIDRYGTDWALPLAK